MVAMSFAVWASPTLHVKVCQGIAGVIAGEDKYEQAVSRQALQREFDKLKQPRDIPFRRCP